MKMYGMTGFGDVSQPITISTTFNPNPSQMSPIDSLVNVTPSSSLIDALPATLPSNSYADEVSESLGPLSTEVNPDLTDLDWSLTGSIIPGIENWVLYALAAFGAFAVVGGRR